ELVKIVLDCIKLDKTLTMSWPILTTDNFNRSNQVILKIRKERKMGHCIKIFLIEEVKEVR
ncbi:hypothetical protein CR513_59023, partial [Mucuna pruriens]